MYPSLMTAALRRAKARPNISYHLYSIWLFTRSDLKTIVIPQSVFGIVNALALSASSEQGPAWAKVLLRLPVVVLWVWINLLPFAIDNQRQPESILEDKQNKPWRTLPSGRMAASQAKTVMLCLYPAAFILSLCLGGLRQCLALMVLGYIYNDLPVTDASWAVRNVINALGFCCFASGALEMAIKMPLSTTGEHGQTFHWLCIIAGVVFSTVQTQDMADQAGDRMRGRSTMPLSIGDGTARWFTAGPMVAWSVLCPSHWGVGLGPCIVVWATGLGVAFRTIAFRTVEADKRTFRLWNAWMGCLYALPLLAALGL
ncbi:hypothetical protein GQ53DRAFT_707713 [Thozetella sp. PMI_491]|nr:hypothetical protein GQ53DRAFT_707713 [Thozetella sp. PMI_491]